MTHPTYQTYPTYRSYLRRRRRAAAPASEPSPNSATNGRNVAVVGNVVRVVVTGSVVTAGAGAVSTGRCVTAVDCGIVVRGLSAGGGVVTAVCVSAVVRPVTAVPVTAEAFLSAENVAVSADSLMRASSASRIVSVVAASVATVSTGLFVALAKRAA